MSRTEKSCLKIVLLKTNLLGRCPTKRRLRAEGLEILAKVLLTQVFLWLINPTTENSNFCKVFMCLTGYLEGWSNENYNVEQNDSVSLFSGMNTHVNKLK